MSRSLRVLLISGEYPPMEGGVSDFTHLLGVALAEQGADVHVLSSVKAAPTQNAVPIQCHPLMHSWSWWSLYTAMQRLVGELRPDVVNIQYQAAAYGLHPAINLLPWVCRQAPVVTTFHDLLVPYLFPKAGRLRWGANLALARGSRAVIVTNLQDRIRLETYPWLSHLYEIPIGSNIPDTLPPDYDRVAWRKRWGVGDDTLLLCYFGFLNASKGGEELIEALDNVCRAGYNVVLLMLGGSVGASDPTNHAYLERVQDLIHARGLDQRVIWAGFMPPEQVSASLHSADLCVLPYRDGVSFRRGSFMAALVHAIPIVSTTPQVSLPALVSGENLMLVPPGDAGALAAAIMHLARDEALRERLGHGARELARSFDWQHIAARTLEVYHAIAPR
jgi:glycosyltransferase involved in cell wall biosynthesis